MKECFSHRGVLVLIKYLGIIWVNAELSPKRYRRGPRSQEVGERRKTIGT